VNKTFVRSLDRNDPLLKTEKRRCRRHASRSKAAAFSGEVLKMTWQGGKIRREEVGGVPFARLRALAGPNDDAARSVDQLSKALSGFGTAVRLHIRLVSGADGETVEHWEVQGGSKSPKAKKGAPKDADILVVMRPETWAQIAQGQLAPYEALYTGKLRVGGDFEKAKAIVKHLTDPASSYVAPC
jgi:SCP-2 sterol transfer family